MLKEKRKEFVRQDFLEMIKNSWTYAKLTENEKKNIKEIIFSMRMEGALKGTYEQRWEILNAMYYTFLKALNYNSLSWRETETTKPLF